MPYVTPGRLVLLILAVLALSAIALAPALVLQLAIRFAVLAAGVGVVLALKPRS